MKILTDFRKTVETGMDPRLDTDSEPGRKERSSSVRQRGRWLGQSVNTS